MSSWSPSLPIIHAENISQATGYDSVVVILLWAPWDPTSRSLDAWLKQAGAGYTNLHFSVMDLDQEQNWPLAREWGILNTPTLVCLFNGVFHERIVGRMPEPQMRAKRSDWARLSDEQPSESKE